MYYDENYLLLAVDFWGDSRVSFDGRTLLGRPYRAEEDFFRSLDPEIETDGSGFISRRLGITLYASGAMKEPQTPVEAVTVFERGYYERGDPGLDA
ncbi:MAG: hypothetical protein AAB074_21025 [Planctomycetota bacterium]